MSVRFFKVQSVGNHFALAELRSFASDADLVRFAIDSGRRRFGVGTDGLLGVALEDGFLRVRMFNTDGTEDFCGNGIRCAVHWAYLQGWIGERAIVRHLGREVPVEVDPSTGAIRTLLGRALFDPSSVPLKNGQGEMFESPLTVAGTRLSASCLSTGTAHTVLFVDNLPDDATFFELSPQIETHEMFPERTSVMWTQVVSDRRLKLRIWERGVGETWGCGSGSMAAAAVYLRKTGLSGSVSVENPGGTLTVSGNRWDDDLWLEGRAQIVFEADWLLKVGA